MKKIHVGIEGDIKWSFIKRRFKFTFTRPGGQHVPTALADRVPDLVAFLNGLLSDQNERGGVTITARMFAQEVP